MKKFKAIKILMLINVLIIAFNFILKLGVFFSGGNVSLSEISMFFVLLVLWGEIFFFQTKIK